MPTLNWIGKEKIVNHHQEVPYRILEHQYSFSMPTGQQLGIEIGSGSKIIHGDNLKALKALLPQYEGKVKCIYIDPPYNTGKENWRYNDNVNHPQVKHWLNSIVGKDGDDLTRHDKWLCMMYPRLRLLRKLLSEDGVIFISIDNNEQANLRLICDEIFGAKNLFTQFTWRSEGNFDNQAKAKVVHEYVLSYFKNIQNVGLPKAIDPSVHKNSKIFKGEIRNTIVKNGRKNPASLIKLPIGFPSKFNMGIIQARANLYPHYKQDAIIENFKTTNEVEIYSGWSSKDLIEDFINKGCVEVIDQKGQNTSFELLESGTIEMVKCRQSPSHVVSILQGLGSTQNMSNDLKRMGIAFDYPKPVQLIEYLIGMYSDEDSIVLDAFAGSGTTAHAVLNMNTVSGKRKFILIQIDEFDKEGNLIDITNEITVKRVKTVISGYNDIEGTGGGFDFYSLGMPIFGDDDNLNEDVAEGRIREYVYYSETKQSLFTAKPNQGNDNKYFLNNFNDTAYYFIYERGILTTLDSDFLATIKTKAGQYLIYADNCLLDKAFMQEKNIIFKKIPRDITRF
ncbi:MAG: site-specific DNA-methyltransferase [Chitinophagaceae bacterium]